MYAKGRLLMKTKSLNMKSLTLALAVGLPMISFAEDLAKLDTSSNLASFMRYEPKPPPVYDNVVLSENIKGLVLVRHKRDMLSQKDLENIEGFETQGIEVPGGSFFIRKKAQIDLFR